MTKSRLRIFNRDGELRAEFDATCPRSWVMGDKGTASFTVSVNETYCNNTVLNFNNWVIVEHDKLPTWIGQISSREWGVRNVTCALQSPEWFLSNRIGETEKIVTGSAGAIFAEIINQANREEQSIIRVGNLFNGDSMQETINPTPLSQDLKRIYTRSGEEYQWRADFNDKGLLTIYGDWVGTLGKELVFSLQEGKSGGNIEASGRILVEDAPEANYILGYGNGLTWTTKPIAISEDAASQAKYGLTQQSISYYGVTTTDTIRRNTFAELQIRKNPFSMYNIVAIDVGTTFYQLDLGNILQLKMQNIGFTNGNLGTDATVRIMGMYYNPLSGEKISLALQTME